MAISYRAEGSEILICRLKILAEHCYRFHNFVFAVLMDLEPSQGIVVFIWPLKIPL